MKRFDETISTDYNRKCPICKAVINYLDAGRRNKAEKSQTLCKSCSNKKRSATITGKRWKWKSDESKKRTSDAHKNSEVWRRSMNSVEYREKQRLSKSGVKNYMFGKSHSPDVRKRMSDLASNRMKNPDIIQKLKSYVWTDEQRKKHLNAIRNPKRLRKLREYRLRQLAQSGTFPSYNTSACEFFDYVNDSLGWSGKHALNGGEHPIVGYSADYYNQSENLVIEWDEERHFRGKKIREKDVIRQKHILDTGVKMYRIREKTGEVSKVDEHAADYTYKLQEIINEYRDKKAKTAVYQH